MANIDNVQLPDGSSYNIVDTTSNFASQTYVDNAVSGVTKTTIGLGNVDNTADLSKPVSTAQQTAINNAVAPKVDKTDIAPVEDSSTASQSYAIGDQFYYNGLLYKATAVINSGGTITPNGNCEASDNLTEQLKNLKPTQEYVEINYTSSETWGTVLARLRSAVDMSKITDNSRLVPSEYEVYYVDSPKIGQYCRGGVDASQFVEKSVRIDNQIAYLWGSLSGLQNITTQGVGAGGTLRLYY